MSQYVVRQYSLDAIPSKEMNAKAFHKVIKGVKGEMSYLVMKKGGVIGPHHHFAEQITYIAVGHVLVFTQGKKFSVKAGQVIVIPSNIEHQFVAVEDTLDIDFFAPPKS